MKDPRSADDGPRPKVTDRDMARTAARVELGMLLTRWQDQHELTLVEVVKILADRLAKWAQHLGESGS